MCDAFFRGGVSIGPTPSSAPSNSKRSLVFGSIVAVTSLLLIACASVAACALGLCRSIHKAVAHD